jgi:hypothetical protein
MSEIRKIVKMSGKNKRKRRFFVIPFCKQNITCVVTGQKKDTKINKPLKTYEEKA